MSPLEWATRPLKKYADFSGRAPRAEYWWFVLLYVIVSVVAQIIDSMLGIPVLGPYGIATCAVIVAILVPSIAVGVRRLHDTDRTGWWLLAPAIPYGIAMVMMGPALLDPTGANLGSMGLASLFLLVGVVLAIVLLVFYCTAGTKGPNNYGDDPYAGGAERAL
jgi:uncharacterized membrane protein YhaH (DUF805 family)